MITRMEKYKNKERLMIIRQNLCNHHDLQFIILILSAGHASVFCQSDRIRGLVEQHHAQKGLDYHSTVNLLKFLPILAGAHILTFS